MHVLIFLQKNSTCFLNYLNKTLVTDKKYIFNYYCVGYGFLIIVTVHGTGILMLAIIILVLADSRYEIIHANIECM